MQIKTIIHGHFYQPPREDPWTNNIEEQPSAYPFKNWNQRITSDCYGPNAYSRVLDPQGKIKKIINNYQYISFNFGPTLLAYLEIEEKEIYNLIIEADKKSVKEHNGHGNAIAQIYNHVIMPLQSFEDKKTQIIWALRDFERRFGRASEGMWLSEAAVDYKTIDLLIEYGIKFIVLSPDQASTFRKIDEEKWTKTNEKQIKTTISYKISRSHGEIGVFYYDKSLSTAISFEHLLRSADNFAHRIINHHNIASEDDVLIIASDGEIYGHHEPFADMCLSSLINQYHLDNNKIRLMNFGEYLEEFPPLYETEIYLGEDKLGSSWSCSHGVGRWYKDCGCKTGGGNGWNQKWRTPFREALDIVKKEIDELFIKELSPYTENPFDLRNDYIDYMFDYEKNDLQFLTKHIKKQLSKEETLKIINLLEAQKYSLFAYTSCAWFFTELTGIETVQNIKYAYKALNVLGDKSADIKTHFENKMEEAKSNIPEFHNGKWVLNYWIYPFTQDNFHIVNSFVTLFLISSTIDVNALKISKNFYYKNFIIDKKENDFYFGKIDIIDKRNHYPQTFYFIYKTKDQYNHTIYISENDDILKEATNRILSNNFDQNKDIRVLKSDDLPQEIRNIIIEYSNFPKIEEIISNEINLISDLKKLAYSYKEAKSKLPQIVESLVRCASESLIYKLSNSLVDFPTKEEYQNLSHLFELINYFSINIDTLKLKDCFSSILYKKLFEEKNPFSDVYSSAITLIEFCNKININIEKSKTENIVFNFLKNEIPLLIQKINEIEKEDEKIKIMLQIRKLIILADTFNINTDDEKMAFFKHFEDIKPSF
ncbi:MAG: hypothetical protein A2Y34_00895 [Spirochaetes bacterium GWC1_27_15]|nr:MAG: hypothetical protein A2Y34_00895 [Spirochaetes bacterium GWC1_27_15]